MDFAVRLFKNSVEIPSPATDALCQAAADAQVYVVMGLTERRANTTGTLYNTQLFIDRRGEIIGKHRKLVPTVGERLVHSGGSGQTLGPFFTEYGPVSGLSCGENSNPLALAALAPRYTVVHVAGWPNHFVPGLEDVTGNRVLESMPESSLLASRNVAFM